MNLQRSKTIIVDDEPNAAHLLQSILNGYPILGSISVFTNATEAFNSIIEQKPNYLFLDVQMPEISGLQLYEKVKPHSPNTKVIYVTAYDKYALDALRQNAFDYLLKPVIKSELIRIVDKLMSELPEKKELLYNEYLMVSGFEGIHHVGFKDIVFLEADGSYTSLVLKTGKKILSTINLGKIAPELPENQFIRISRKHLVNREYTVFYHSKNKFVRLETPEKEYQLEVTIKVHDIKQLLGK